VNDEPIIDRERLSAVSMGQAAMARELIDLLIEETAPLVDAVAGLLAARDAAGIRQQAHAVKGMAGNVGAMRLQSAALALERGASDGAAWDVMGDRCAAFSGALVELRAERERET
jgi:HPt (histidine-containing phosphotransfer) domain-containing protein